MSPNHDATLQRLVKSLRPVRRLRPPWQRASLWLATAFLAGLISCIVGHNESLGASGKANAWHWSTFLSAAATAVAAAFAMFALSVPGHSSRWWLAPVATALAWIACSIGVQASSTHLATWGSTGGQVLQCLGYLLFVSAALAGLAIVMLRRAWPLYPIATAALAGLASGAAAAAMLGFSHPHTGTWVDTVAHVGALLAVAALAAGMSHLLSRDGDIESPR